MLEFTHLIIITLLYQVVNRKICEFVCTSMTNFFSQLQCLLLLLVLLSKFERNIDETKEFWLFRIIHTLKLVDWFKTVEWNEMFWTQKLKWSNPQRKTKMKSKTINKKQPLPKVNSATLREKKKLIMIFYIDNHNILYCVHYKVYAVLVLLCMNIRAKG